MKFEYTCRPICRALKFDIHVFLRNKRVHNIPSISMAMMFPGMVYLFFGMNKIIQQQKTWNPVFENVQKFIYTKKINILHSVTVVHYTYNFVSRPSKLSEARS